MKMLDSSLERRGALFCVSVEVHARDDTSWVITEGVTASFSVLTMMVRKVYGYIQHNHRNDSNVR